MTIRSAKELKRGKIKIDLTGPDGNAFVLLGYAKQYAKQLNRDFEPIQKRMTAGDYDNLVKVFDEEFGEFVNLYR
jgi:hypothetical protein